MKKNSTLKVLATVVMAICLVAGAVPVPQVSEPVVAMADDVMNMCVGDELFYYNSSYKYYSSNKKVLTVDKEGKLTAVGVGSCDFNITSGGYTFKHKVNVTYLGSKSADKKAKKLVKKITKNCKSDFEKVKAVHDYLVLNTAYDYKNYLNGTIPESSYTAKGAIDKGKAVCEGYAKAFLCFMNMLDIPCKMVSGRGNGGDHAWNLVKIDKKWFQIDVTWDDPVPDRPGEVSYEYFLLTDAKMGESHTWDKTGLPKCKSSADKYMSSMGDICKSLSDVTSVMKKQLNAGKSKIEIIVANSSGISWSDVKDCWYGLGYSEISYYLPVEKGSYTIYAIDAK